MYNVSAEEDLEQIFGEVPEIVTFDEVLYETDLSFIISSI